MVAWGSEGDQVRARSDEFAAAVRDACARHGFQSTRHAEQRTGMEHSTISRMMNGYVPGQSVVVRWAAALGESPNKWLELAGHPVLPAPRTRPLAGDSDASAAQQVNLAVPAALSWI